MLISSVVVAISMALPAPGGQPISASHTAQGLTLTLVADCGTSRAPCPFRAQVTGAPGVTRMIERVDYTYVPDQRTPVAIGSGATSFAFQGAQRPGELVYANVILRAQGSAKSKPVLLEAAIPFAADVRPALPAGLRFEDGYRAESLEGGMETGYYRFRIWLRGDRSLVKGIRSITYGLPKKHFPQTVVRGDPDAEYFLTGSAMKGEKWDVVAVIRWTNGRTSTHRIPFRPE